MVRGVDTQKHRTSIFKSGIASEITWAHSDWLYARLSVTEAKAIWRFDHRSLSRCCASPQRADEARPDEQDPLRATQQQHLLRQTDGNKCACGCFVRAEDPCEASASPPGFTQPSLHIDWLMKMENFPGARNLRSISPTRALMSLWSVVSHVITAPCRGILPSGTSNASRKGQKYRADKRGTTLTNGRHNDAVFACS